MTLSSTTFYPLFHPSYSVPGYMQLSGGVINEEKNHKKGKPALTKRLHLYFGIKRKFHLLNLFSIVIGKPDKTVIL
jgi:hypothetical protein